MLPPTLKRDRLSALLASAGLLFALSAGASAQTTYSVIDLAPGSCGVTAINDNGVVVGQCGSTAVVWQGGAPIGLGKLPGGNYSSATAINLAGVIVGDGDTGNFRPQSWVNTPAGLLNIFPNNGGNTHALFIADNGAIGGYYTKSLSGSPASWHGAIWTRDPKDPRKYVTTDLPVLAGGDPKLAGILPAAFNQLGQAAGYATNTVIGQHAAFWDNDAAHTIHDLGVFAGDWTSLAFGMNDLGQVVGESHPPFGDRAVLWQNDAARTIVELPLLPGDNFGSAQKINNAGHILGWSAYATPNTWNVGPSRTVIWRDGGVFDLQTLLDPASGAGWKVTSAVAINNLGQIIGYGTHNGETRCFVLTPLH